MEDVDVAPSMFKSVGIFRALEYLDSLQKPDGRTPVILEWLAEDIHNYKEVIAKRLGKMKNFRRIIMSILGLMIKGDERYSTNATYIMAMLSETDLVVEEILIARENDFVSSEDTSQPRDLLALISCVIHNGDEQSVMNALALLGNLLKTNDGVQWLLTNSPLCLNDVLDDVISMVSDKSPTAISNAELIIARICTLEKGRDLVYCHPFFDQLISHLIFSLESLDKKVVQNAAYALTELCHSRLICKVVINTQWATNMAEMLLKLLTSDRIPIRIHSCKVLQSLASSEEGFMFLNEIQDAENMLLSLINMLDSSVENEEIGLAAIRFLITFAEHQDGCLRIRQSQNICMLLKHYELNFANIPDTLKNEISFLNQQLEFLSQPDPPKLIVQGSRSILVDCVYHRDAIYEIWQGTTIVHSGQESSYLVEDLDPYTEYSFRLRLLHGCDRSPFSAVVIARTLEGEPGTCLHLSAGPMSCHQIRVSWDTPQCINGLLKEYKIYRNGCVVTTSSETCVIVSGLQPQQGYKFEVSCVNGSHEGPRVAVFSKAFPEVYNATSRPSVVVLSDQEVFVTWQKPLHLSGQLIRYELNVNGTVVYSGIDTKYTVKALTPDETYEFVVTVVSTDVTAKSEGVCRKTAKAQGNSTKALLPKNKNDTRKHSGIQDSYNAPSVCEGDLKASESDSHISNDSRQSPDHVSGQIMQSLLDQYSNECSQSTLIDPTAAVCGKQIIHDPEPRTSSFCNEKCTRASSHQKSSLTPINISSTQKEKMLSKSIALPLPRNSNKQSLKHLKSKPTCKT